MHHWAQGAAALIAAEGAAVMVTVAHTRGSVPRAAPTRMLVGATGMEGTIGGGNLEYQAVDQARKLMAAPVPRPLFQQYALGPLLEQCCGGAVTLLLEYFDAEDIDHLRAVANAFDGFVRTEFDGHKKQILNADDLPDGLPDGWEIAFFDADGVLLTPDTVPRAPAVMLERIHRLAPSLYMFGAGHVGRAVAQALAPLNFAITWVDERAAEFPAFVPDNAMAIISDDPISVVASSRPGSLYLIFTHSHQMDYAITAAVLTRGDARYCGLIGSATKRARFESRMLKEGRLTVEQMTHLTCPIGLPGIRGKEPEVIAVSVAAQLLALD